jgi:murein L,D-transpeptidase YafK
MTGRVKTRTIISIIAACLLSAAVAVMLFAWFPGTALNKAADRAGTSLDEMQKNSGKVSLRVYKQEKRLEILWGDTVVKTYRVSTGPGIPDNDKPPGKIGDKALFLRGLRYHSGNKRQQGDLRTPEGTYYLVYDFRPSRVNYRFALLSYPDEAASQRLSGNPGGSIGIHGLYRPLNYFGRLHTLVRHTRGCIALTNREVDELDAVVRKGTEVKIYP